MNIAKQPQEAPVAKQSRISEITSAMKSELEGKLQERSVYEENAPLVAECLHTAVNNLAMDDSGEIPDEFEEGHFRNLLEAALATYFSWHRSKTGSSTDSKDVRFSTSLNVFAAYLNTDMLGQREVAQAASDNLGQKIDSTHEQVDGLLHDIRGNASPKTE